MADRDDETAGPANDHVMIFAPLPILQRRRRVASPGELAAEVNEQ